MQRSFPISEADQVIGDPGDGAQKIHPPYYKNIARHPVTFSNVRLLKPILLHSYSDSFFNMIFQLKDHQPLAVVREAQIIVGH